MAGTIIGLNRSTAKNVASSSDLESLYNYLNTSLGKRFVINGYGEALGPSATRPWSLTGSGSVLEYFQSGGVFIAYCGWPMRYTISPSGYRAGPTDTNFPTFAKGLGYSWLNGATFTAKAGQTTSHGDYWAFARGFNLSGSLNGLYIPHGAFSETLVPWSLNGAGYAAMLGIHRSGIGWYFWGTHNSNLFQTIFQRTATVPPDVYGAFIEACVHGQTSASGKNYSLSITHEAYSVPSTGTSKNTSGSSTPYGSSGSGSGSGSSSGSGSFHASTSNTSTASAMPSWVAPVVGAGALAGITAGLWYYGAGSRKEKRNE